jgi:hypothetical protein
MIEKYCHPQSLIFVSNKLTLKFNLGIGLS